jgi:hypothetical protein
MAAGSRLFQASSKASAARNSSALASPWDIKSRIKCGSRFSLEAVPREREKRDLESSITRTTICLYLPLRIRWPSSSIWSILSMKPSSWCSERLPESSLRRSAISATVLGSDSRSLGFIWITQISSGRSSVSSLTGGFCEKSPSQ